MQKTTAAPFVPGAEAAAVDTPDFAEPAARETRIEVPLSEVRTAAVAQAVIRQLVSAPVPPLNLAERPVELLLEPAELGRVRMSLSHEDGAMVLQVTADRAETLDLLRRNAGQLTAEFRDLGYARVSLSFGTAGGWSAQSRGHGGAADGGPGTKPDADPVASPPQALTLRLVPTDRLDLRI